jgi:hypothetical protein
MHADDAVLLAYLDGELDDIRRAAVGRHLAGCAACAAELEELRLSAGGLAAALAHADLPAPTDAARAAVARRRAAPAGLRTARRALLRAALLVLGVAGAAAAAVPGSPVRRWIERAVAPAPAPAPAPPVRTAQPEPAAEEAPAAGVSFPVENARVRVVIRGAGPALRVRTRVSSGSTVEVSATGPAAHARFRTGPGRVEVVGAEAGEVLVVLPAAAADATVEVDGAVVLAREGGVLRFPGPRPDSTAAGLVFRPRR